MNQDVTDYIEGFAQPWQVEVCTAIRQRIHDTVPDVEERLQYKKPHFLKNGTYLAVLGPAKGLVTFTMFNAAGLDAPDGTFEPGGAPERKNIRIREGQAVDHDLLGRLVTQAAATI